MKGYAQAIKRGDVEWLLNFFADDKNFVLADDGELSADYQLRVGKRYREDIENIKEVLHSQFMNGHAYVLDKEAVSYVTNFDWGMITISGDTVKSKGSWLHVFKKLDEDWKVIHSAGTHIYY